MMVAYYLSSLLMPFTNLADVFASDCMLRLRCLQNRWWRLHPTGCSIYSWNGASSKQYLASER